MLTLFLFDYLDLKIHLLLFRSKCSNLSSVILIPVPFSYDSQFKFVASKFNFRVLIFHLSKIFPSLLQFNFSFQSNPLRFKYQKFFVRIILLLSLILQLRLRLRSFAVVTYLFSTRYQLSFRLNFVSTQYKLLIFMSQ